MSAKDILISGGGIGGLSAALCLAAKGFTTRVFEQASNIGEIGAGIQLSPNCTRVLHSLGLESALLKVAFVPTDIEMRDWKTGDTIARNELGQSVRDRYGYPYYHIHRADLIDTLATAAADHPNITLHTNAAVSDIESDDETVSITAGSESYSGAALIGADGIRSVVRDHQFGADAPVFTGNVAWRGLIPVQDIPSGFVRPVSTAWWGPGAHFVHYYVRGGDLVNCVCVVEKEGWEQESWIERGDIAELKSDFSGWHNGVQRLIDAIDPQACFKWALFDRPPMPKWSTDRITLLGDACHPTLPFMAQGAAMAIEDGAVLAACLGSGTNIADSFVQYESLRRNRTARIQQGSRDNARRFHLRGADAIARNETAGQARSNTNDWLYRYNALDLNAAQASAFAQPKN